MPMKKFYKQPKLRLIELLEEADCLQSISNTGVHTEGQEDNPVIPDTPWEEMEDD